ncbi:MAG TPA: bifunctional glutamate--cysteine ligase GshA/glutathione synthetase GshB [Prolixibacteraceae bacterium]|nr:bifunctional glutamate--cysteine ligase GshA/glutathione synthetase GshB [Prolixibacteraceae bacterium]
MERDLFQKAKESLKGNIWLDALFGLERENIRVDKRGHMALTPHPEVFGNKAKHPYITTDFSESQVEMITPPLPSISQALGFLETLNDIVSLELKDEYLWPQSIPPILPDEDKIPVARYEGEAIAAQHYREFLARKYGARNLLFSGIHFNLSFSDKLLEMLYRKSKSSLSFEEFKDEAYLKTTRQILRLRWLYILLYGNSPVVDSSMQLQCKLSPYTIDSNIIGLSIRNSCFGYQNLDELYPDYSSVKAFRSSVDQMISDGLLAAHKELYSPVRPKFINGPDHITYLELRFIDINPLTRAGITKEALHFLHALALYGLLSDETDDFDAKAQAVANKYHGCVALYALNSTPPLMDEKSVEINVWTEATTHIREMVSLFEALDITDEDYLQSLSKAKLLVDDPKQREVFKVLTEVLKEGYIAYHMKNAHHYLEQSRQKNYNFIGLEDMELSTQILMREAVKRGVTVEILDRKENFIRLQKEENTQYVKQATKTSLDNYASILAMENKLVTKRILAENGIRVPNGNEYTDPVKAKADFELLQGKAVVIKPNQTNFGIGITILKENRNELAFRRAVDIAFEHDTTILIEEFVAGKEFRFFVIGDEVAGILRRIPANVTGDGLKTIRELVELKNQDPLRGKGYRTPLEKIQTGEAEAMFLKGQNKNFDFVPGAGETVYLRENSNISTGGDSVDVTDEILDSYKQIALKAAKALNVIITGLDMMIPDTAKEATDDNYAIIELNFNPAIHIHCHPFKGQNRKLNEKIMDALGYRIS